VSEINVAELQFLYDLCNFQIFQIGRLTLAIFNFNLAFNKMDNNIVCLFFKQTLTICSGLLCCDSRCYVVQQCFYVNGIN